MLNLARAATELAALTIRPRATVRRWTRSTR